MIEVVRDAHLITIDSSGWVRIRGTVVKKFDTKVSTSGDILFNALSVFFERLDAARKESRL